MTTPRLFLGIFALTLLLPLLLLACSGSPPPDPTATEATTQPPTTTQPQTLSPTLRTPTQTLNPWQIQATQQAQLATIRTLLPPPTPQVIYPTAPRPFPTLVPPPTTPPFLLQTLEPPQVPTLTPWVLPTLEPLPTPRLPVLPTLSPLPTVVVPTVVPVVPVPSLSRKPQWVMDYEAGYSQALVLTPLETVPVRGIFVDCNTDGDQPRLALRIVGEEVFPPTTSFGVDLAYAIDGDVPVTTMWLPVPGESQEGFQRLYPAQETGTAIIDALLGGARLIEVGVGNIEYSFETHGFSQVAIPLIESCQSPVPTATQPSTPHLRYMDEKGYMLRLVNNERRAAGVPEVVLGVNDAAQLHAEDSLEGCYSSHWGSDGLKPYMRYSLAGGYQSNSESNSGLDYCIKARDGYAALSGIETEIRETMAGWMGSSGHRRNILEKNHRRVNIGLAWDRYNLIAVQHFEGDYVEYVTFPEFDEDRLRLEGKVKNGVRFDTEDVIPVQIFYDPPPHSLTPGQLSRTYCYDFGLPVAYLREPLTGGWSYPKDTLNTSYSPCSSPYDVSPDALAPQSPSQALAHWQAAYDANRSTKKNTAVMQAITASSWRTENGGFRITASLGNVLKKHGPGVYTVVLWGIAGGDIGVISQYSIFYGIPRPNGYD